MTDNPNRDETQGIQADSRIYWVILRVLKILVVLMELLRVTKLY